LSAELVAGPLRPLFRSWPAARLWIPAVGLSDGRRVVFGRRGAPAASVPDAVAASCAIPGYFAPVEIAGRRYVDGGAWSVTNADLAAGEALDLVLILSPMSTARSGIPGAVGAAFRAAVRTTLGRERAALARHGTRVVVYEPGRELARVMGEGPWTPEAWRRTARLARAEAELAGDLAAALGQPPLPVR
jgi:NTE family protein